MAQWPWNTSRRVQKVMFALRVGSTAVLTIFSDETVAVPVFDNDQDIPRLQAAVDSRWNGMAVIPPGYLIRGHGVYVWAEDMPGALLRLEALEFMLACELEERRLTP